MKYRVLTNGKKYRIQYRRSFFDLWRWVVRISTIHRKGTPLEFNSLGDVISKINKRKSNEKGPGADEDRCWRVIDTGSRERSRGLKRLLARAAIGVKNANL